MASVDLHTFYYNYLFVRGGHGHATTYMWGSEGKALGVGFLFLYQVPKVKLSGPH